MFSARNLISVLVLGGFLLLIICIPEVQKLTRRAVSLARGATPKRMDFLDWQYYLLLIAVVFLTVFVNTMLPSKASYAPGIASWYAVWYSYGGLLMILAAPVLLLLGGRAYQAAVLGSEEQVRHQSNLAGLCFGLLAFFLWASCYLQLLSRAT